MLPFLAVPRQSVADGVFEQIVGQIVEGTLDDGDALPSERHLAEVFEVSRPVVREALQRLAQTGMVAIRQGESTTVQPWRRTAGPDLLSRLLLGTGAGIDWAVARSILEVRQRVGPHIAALAATRSGGDESLARDLHDHLARLESLTDLGEQQWAAVAFWDLLVDASDNVAYRLMTNALTAAYAPLIDSMAQVMRAEVADVAGFRAVADAVTCGDAQAASGAADNLLAAGTRAVLDAIALLHEGARP